MQTRQQVLIAEDDNLMRLILEKHLRDWGYEPQIVSNGEEALRKLQTEEAPRLVLLDWVMPVMDGLEVCQRIREIETSDPPYIIVVTAKNEAVEMAACLDSGASDCVGKPFDSKELLARLKVGERTLQLQAQLNEARRKLNQLAMHDGLTGIYNRRAAGERLEQELSRSRRNGSPLQIGLADLDEFKTINDLHGHQAGDAVIQAFVKGARSMIRSSDVIARWGGEEFLIIAPDSSTTPNPVFERILTHTRTLKVPVADNREGVTITVSIGTAEADPEESTDQLLIRADKALYRAKKAGKNQLCHDSCDKGYPPAALIAR